MSQELLSLPEPLTTADCDLSDFQYMELDVRQLRDSKFAATVDAEAFRAGVLLWCAAWHQVPAGSLPDDDVELANLAGFGRVVKEWRKVREEALYGFVKCSDGRLYHSVIAKKAASAYEAKQRHAYDRLRDRLRKENKAREAEGRSVVGTPSYEQWKSGEYRDGIPPSDGDSSTGIPAEMPLRGNRTEQNGTETIEELQLPLSADADDVRLCPVGQLLNLYHELMPLNPRVKVASDSRKAAVRARWKQAAGLEAQPFGYTSRSAGLAAWREFFVVCAESKFLTGQAPPSAPGKPAFIADIDFIFSPGGFAKILENKYHRDAA